MALDLAHTTDDDLKKLLPGAFDAAKSAMANAVDHVDDAAAEAVGRANEIWKELKRRGLLP